MTKCTDIRRGGGGFNQLTELSHRHTLDLLLTSQLPGNKTRCFSTRQSAVTHPQRGDNVLESDNCPSDRSAEGFRFLSHATTRSDTSRILRVRFEEYDVYLPPKPVTLSNLKERIRTARKKRLNILWCKMLGKKSDIALTCAGKQMEHTLNLHTV